MRAAAKIYDAISSDELLLEHARMLDGTAYCALVERYSDAVYTIARNMCPTLRDAEDVLHQAFVDAWRNLRTLPAGARFGTWQYGIAMNTALSYRERNRRSAPCSLETLLPSFDPSGRLVLADHRSPDLPESSPAPIEITGLLREALECIDDRVRAAFVLRDLLHLTAEEAAVVLRTTPKVIRRDAHRARLLLRGFIERL
jgi:RNA polymerase sigma-70 factor (ECF subfamily)